MKTAKDLIWDDKKIYEDIRLRIKGLEIGKEITPSKHIDYDELKQSAIEDIKELERRENSLHIQGQIDYIRWKFDVQEALL